MVEVILLIIGGVLLLVVGGEALLRGAVASAGYFKLSPAIVGLTIVAAATSVPELAVSLSAALQGSSDIAIGNVVGSNIANICLILGLSALFTPLLIEGQTIKLEYPFLAVVTYLLLVLSNNGVLDRYEGSLLFLLYFVFMGYMLALVRKQMTAGEEAKFAAELDERDGKGLSPFLTLIYIIAGVGLLWGGAELTVKGAVLGAQIFGVSDRVIGLTVVAVGTSLPELVASLVSAYRGRGDIAVGNIVGSNIFNILIILGLTAWIQPMNIHEGIIQSDNWWMLGSTVALFPLMYTHLRITRGEGVLLMTLYAVYLVSLIGFGG